MWQITFDHRIIEIQVGRDNRDHLVQVWWFKRTVLINPIPSYLASHHSPVVFNLPYLLGKHGYSNKSSLGLLCSFSNLLSELVCARSCQLSSPVDALQGQVWPVSQGKEQLARSSIVPGKRRSCVMCYLPAVWRWKEREKTWRIESIRWPMLAALALEENGI